MTDPQRIRALITRLETEGGSREASDEYLVLVCDGWKMGNGIPYNEQWEDGAHILEPRPDPTTNAQDALDSLPGDIGVEHGSDLAIQDDIWFCRLFIDETLCGRRTRVTIAYHIGADTEAEATCITNLRRELAELEGGDGVD